MHSSLGQSTLSRLKVVGHKKHRNQVEKKTVPQQQAIRSCGSKEEEKTQATINEVKSRWPGHTLLTNIYVCTREMSELFC